MAWQTLVTAEQVADRLGDPRLRVFDCRYELASPAAGREAYLRGHLPGAVHADLHHDLAAPTTPASGRHPLPSPEDFAVLNADPESFIVELCANTARLI